MNERKQKLYICGVYMCVCVCMHLPLIHLFHLISIFNHTLCRHTFPRCAHIIACLFAKILCTYDYVFIRMQIQICTHVYIYTHLCLHITFVQLHINIHIACKSLDCIACPVTLDFIGFCRFISTYRQSTIVQYVPSGPQECARHWKVVGQLPVGVALPTSHWDDTTSKPYKR